MTINLISFSQGTGNKKGDKVLNIGLGVNSHYLSGIPFGASLDVPISDEISISGYFDYLSTSEKVSYPANELKYKVFYIGGRVSYNFNELLALNRNKFDIYLGAALGYRIFSGDDKTNAYYDGDNKYSSKPYLGAFTGGKYYFTEKFGCFAELGILESAESVRIGIAFKL